MIDFGASRERYGPDASEATGLGLGRVTGRVHLGSQPDPVSVQPHGSYLCQAAPLCGGGRVTILRDFADAVKRCRLERIVRGAPCQI
jgi:hypothetical protein